tara:strand:- start:37 stop:681 length:645 start_codon:yes stop_codon:yes gene_type:complete
MADNKLVPDPVNALTTAASAYPSYQDLLKFLGANQPPIRFAPLDAETRGEYDRAARYGNTGEIRMNTNSLRYMRDDPTATARTLIHETTHATDRQLDNLYFKYKDRPPTPEIAQFVEGYKRLRWSDKNPNARVQAPPSEALARRLDPKWAAENAGYRANSAELYGHAVGNTARTPESTRYGSIDTPLHLDPTLATEHFVLLDLANRAQKSLQAK